MRKAIFFDFDYTLGDSTNGIVLSADYALEKLGRSPKSREEIRRTIGLSLKETYAALAGKNDPDEAALFAHYFKEKADEVMVANTKLYDGAKETLRGFKENGCQTGIITTKLRYRIEKILDKFQAANLVDLIVGSDDVKLEKPDPEGLLLALERLRLEKSEALYVGDSLVDARAAENAGIDFAGVLTGTTVEQEFARHKHIYIGKDVTDIFRYVMDFGA